MMDKKALGQALELQQAHTRQRQERLRARAIALRAEGLPLTTIVERLGVGLGAVRTMLGLGLRKKGTEPKQPLLTAALASGTTDDGTEQNT